VCIPDTEPSSVADVESFVRVAAVPEPGTLGLLAATLAGAGFARRRKAAAR
jgi:hypothetical protein